MIGRDFEKIHFELFGLEMMEPMGFITDMIMGGISVFLAIKVFKYSMDKAFNTYWFGFFLIFGLGSIIGGFGHLLYNYWEISGKIPSWISGPLAVYCLEQAMISVMTNEKWRKILKVVSLLKMLVALAAMTLIILLAQDLVKQPSKAFLPIAINTILGVSLSAGLIGNHLAKKVNPNFKYFVLGVLIMIPSAFIFLMKINLHQWFDKNDLSHVLLTTGIIYFFIGLKKIQSSLT